MRYRNCAMAGLASVIGAAIAYSAVPGEVIWVPLIFAAVFLITGAGNAINDYFDAGIDAVNRPFRPIPSGRVRKESAFVFSIALFAASIIISYFVGSSRIPFFIAVFNSLLLYFYAFSLKRKVFVGNLSVSYLSGSTFLFGGAAFGIEGIRFTLVLFFLSVLASLARELVKSIEDMEGDRKDGAITLPIKIGERPAAYTACAFGLLAVLLSPLPYFMELFNEYYLLVVGIADVFFLYAVALVLKRNPSASSVYFKVAMLFALLAFIAGSILKREL
ncbi:MAG: geranylgeranylglycerol-phosphate geranylgeranyltransferase [Euryarchaeota archaeon]|nr:geranylgeranylglycerol-phosphate geranylgeranyltransferase [Euryarchaeota archaeon]MBU4492300.1 geranylgeranylglycerol-phosphate geranylgeranyltransferase [Euryarchaeota archaeon]MCG2728536.1 geranylgeranylglycerol-phosphate geranylgeranyltransferase [Candidatus Methanoperedenaceae archaeon]